MHGVCECVCVTSQSSPTAGSPVKPSVTFHPGYLAHGCPTVPVPGSTRQASSEQQFSCVSRAKGRACSKSSQALEFASMLSSHFPAETQAQESEETCPRQSGR